MKDNWNELFNALNEEDILRNLPEDLPEMEDELAAKRIENRVLEELNIDVKLQKKQNRKRFLVAAVCCIIAVGIFGREPIQAALQKILYDLPGAGGYIDEAEEKIYEVQIAPSMMEKDGVKVELKNFYAVGKRFYGEVLLTGDLLVYDQTETDKFAYQDLLEEKYEITWYYGEKQREMIDGGGEYRSIDLENGIMQCDKYEVECEEYLYLEDKGIDTYYLQVKGFEERFELKVSASKQANKPEKIGYSQMKNDTTMTARAAVTEDRIELEYYVIPSPEVALAAENCYRHWIVNMPYQYDMEETWYLENKNGERLRYEKSVDLVNGKKVWFEGSEEDFPLKFHYPTLTGTNEEKAELILQLPENGEKNEKDLPVLDFRYGSVEIQSITKEIVEHDIGNTGKPEYVSAVKVDLVYHVTPKDGLRQMYNIDVDVENETYGMSGLNTGDDHYTNGWTIYLAELESETMTVDFEMPSFWIVGDYDIIIEKPMK